MRMILYLYLHIDKQKCIQFCEKSLQEPVNWEYIVNRRALYEDVQKLYSDEVVARSYPIHIAFADEIALDLGEVFRDMLSGFWELAYRNLFDGSNLLTPVIHPQTDTSVFPLIGRIISHGYLVCGFLIIRIALPTLVTIIKGPGCIVPDKIVLDSFPDSLDIHEAIVTRQALCNCDQPFNDHTLKKLISILSKFGCHHVPTH